MTVVLCLSLSLSIYIYIYIYIYSPGEPEYREFLIIRTADVIDDARDIGAKGSRFTYMRVERRPDANHDHSASISWLLLDRTNRFAL